MVLEAEDEMDSQSVVPPPGESSWLLRADRGAAQRRGQESWQLSFRSGLMLLNPSSGAAARARLACRKQRCLTPRSSRAPTASHRARSVARYILHSPGPASRRWCRLSSNVRPHQMPVAPAAVCASSKLRLSAVSAVASAASAPEEAAAVTHIKALPRSGYSKAARGGNAGSGMGLPVWQQRSGRVGRQTCGGTATGWSVRHVGLRLCGVAARSRLSYAMASAPLSLQFSLSHSVVAHTSLLSAGRHPGGSVRAQLGGFHQVRSNPSFKPSPNGKAPGPRYSAVLLLLQRGPGALPLVPV